MDYPTLFLCLLHPSFRNIPLGKTRWDREPSSDLLIPFSASQGTGLWLRRGLHLKAHPTEEGQLWQTAELESCASGMSRSQRGYGAQSRHRGHVLSLGHNIFFFFFLFKSLF